MFPVSNLHRAIGKQTIVYCRKSPAFVVIDGQRYDVTGAKILPDSVELKVVRCENNNKEGDSFEKS